EAEAAAAGDASGGKAATAADVPALTAVPVQPFGRSVPTPHRWADTWRRVVIGPFTPRRAAVAWALAVVAPVLATVVLSQLRDQLGLPSDLLVYLLLTVLAAAAGGWAPGLFAAVTSFLLANWYFTPPIHTFTIGE